ncbi:hypothetical protein JXA88_12265 [Candidatus Fermentibacteria bacterium]|nr:hypothetical protein [Candidatus Fermentibacteria bacterium]
MRPFLVLPLIMACSIPSPQAPTWEVTANVPLVARTVFARDLIGSQGDFFFGEYGPFRVMDSDSVVASLVSAIVVADPAGLQALPSQGEATIAAGTVGWSGNPLDELDNPEFFRVWIELVIRHNLPGAVTVDALIEGWDDTWRPSEAVEVTAAAPPTSGGVEITSTHLITDERVLAFINPSPAHDVPDSFLATCSVTYGAQGEEVGGEPVLSIEISVITAIDLSFDGASVDRRSIVQKLIISPEDVDSDAADLSGNLTKNLRAALIVTDVANNLPLGGLAYVRVDHDSLNLWIDPALLVGPFEFDAPPVDPLSGKSTGVSDAQSSVTLNEEHLDLFSNPGPGDLTLYAAVEYLLDGAGRRRICVCAGDSIRAEALMAITSLVEVDDES